MSAPEPRLEETVEVIRSKRALDRRLIQLLAIGYTVAISYETTNLGDAVYKVSWVGVRHGGVTL